jgi:hypothetical protein
MRRVRGLRPGDPDTFDLITQDQILDVFNKLTGVFFLVMVVLSSVALMVGGIGVMAIIRHRSHPGDRRAKSSRRHQARDPVAVPR